MVKLILTFVGGVWFGIFIEALMIGASSVSRSIEEDEENRKNKKAQEEWDKWKM